MITTVLIIAGIAGLVDHFVKFEVGLTPAEKRVLGMVKARTKLR